MAFSAQTTLTRLPRSRQALDRVAKTLGWFGTERRGNLLLVTNPARPPREDEGEYVFFSAYALAG